jgi:hypothetical protein
MGHALYGQPFYWQLSRAGLFVEIIVADVTTQSEIRYFNGVVGTAQDLKFLNFINICKIYIQTDD